MRDGGGVKSLSEGKIDHPIRIVGMKILYALNRVRYNHRVAIMISDPIDIMTARIRVGYYRRR
jgi:hypothetical protein